jgi:hypothetical protein
MCGVVFGPDGREYRSIAELRGIWPTLVYDPQYGEIDEEACLCQIDIRATAKANRAHGEYDPAFGDFQIEDEP